MYIIPIYNLARLIIQNFYIGARNNSKYENYVRQENSKTKLNKEQIRIINRYIKLQTISLFTLLAIFMFYCLYIKSFFCFCKNFGNFWCRFRIYVFCCKNLTVVHWEKKIKIKLKLQIFRNCVPWSLLKKNKIV